MKQSRALVICARRYNGHELWTLLGILQQKEVAFEVVSTAHTIRDELTLQPNTIERLTKDIYPTHIRNDFDAVCVVSGNMKDTEAYWTDQYVESLLKEARLANKVVSAICCSVPTLAPICTNVKVSFFPLVRSRQRLERHGAILQTTSLTVDQRTITAENQMITEMWADEIVHMLHTPDAPPLYKFQESGFTPKGHERRMPREVRKAIDAAKAQNKS